MAIKAVLFDHDGTLVDSESTHLDMWRRALLPLNVHLSDDEYWSLFLGVPAEQSADLLREKHGLDLTSEDLVAEKMKHTRHYLTQSPFPKMVAADDILSALASHVPLALVSGSQRFCIDVTLAGHQWHKYFQYVVTGDDVDRNKPHPDSYLKALELLNVSAADAITVEDTQSGVRAALAAGLTTVAIRNQYSRGHDFSGVAIEVANLTEAKQWILKQINA